MVIRVLLRVIPLVCVAVFTLGVFVVDAPVERAQAALRAETRHLAWATGLVKCPDLRASLPLAACPAGVKPGISAIILAPPH